MNPSPTNRQTAYEFERQDTASSFRFDPLPPRGSAASVPKPPSSSRGSGGAGGRQITRNRASYSCHTCRRRKVKCDKVLLFEVLCLMPEYGELTRSRFTRCAETA